MPLHNPVAATGAPSQASPASEQTGATFVVPSIFSPQLDDPNPATTPSADLCYRLVTNNRFGLSPSDGGGAVDPLAVKILVKAMQPISLEDAHGGAICVISGYWYPKRGIVYKDGEPYGIDVAQRLSRLSNKRRRRLI